MTDAAEKKARGEDQGRDLGPRRFFFAVWPDERVRSELVQWSESLQTDRPARRVPGQNLHITLVFLGELDEPQIEAIRGVADAATWRGASLVLDRIGYWKRSRIIWAGSQDGSDALSALAADLRDRLQRLGFRIEERPFVPHVTLYRKAQRRPKWRRQQVEWRIDEFCLMESRLLAGGARYEILYRWSAKDDMK